MDLHLYTTIFLFLLISSSSAGATNPPSPPPSSSLPSVLAAAEALRSHGYSLYAAALISTFSNTAKKLSGTILVAPDFIFAVSPPTSKRRALTRPTTTHLLYHSIKPPSLRLLDLATRPDGDELHTLHSDYCLFLFKNPTGVVSIASSKKPALAVNIRQPELYVDDNLTIHGVDGVLDPSAASKCSRESTSASEVQVQSWIHRSFLDRAIRMLRKNGFVVAATALVLRRAELLPLQELTIFAPSDKVFFSSPDGFRYDARRHVVRERLRFDRMSSFTEGVEFETLAPEKPVFIESDSDVVTVNGVRIDGVEVYQNRWLVLYSIEPMTLDDAVGESSVTGKWDESSSVEEVQVPVASNDTMAESLGLIVAEPPSPAQSSILLKQVKTGSPVNSPASDQELVDSEIGKLLMPYLPYRSSSPAPKEGSKLLDQIETGTPAPASYEEYDMEQTMVVVESLAPSPAPLREAKSFQCDISELFCPANEQIQIETESPREAMGGPFDILKRLLLRSEGKGKRDPDSPTMAADLFYYY